MHSGNIDIMNGSASLNHSDIIGDIEHSNGNLIIIDSFIKGNVVHCGGYQKHHRIQADRTIFEGVVEAKNVHLADSTILGELIVPVGKLELSGRNTIGNITFRNSETKEAPEFTLSSGNTITGTVNFRTSPGKLLIEEGAEFVGRIINGSVEYLKPVRSIAPSDVLYLPPYRS